MCTCKCCRGKGMYTCELRGPWSPDSLNLEIPVTIGEPGRVQNWPSARQLHAPNHQAWSINHLTPQPFLSDCGYLFKGRNVTVAQVRSFKGKIFLWAGWKYNKKSILLVNHSAKRPCLREGHLYIKPC